jgi:hypothetical protein
METVPSKVVKKLFRSLDELEQSIAIAKKVLSSQDPIPLEVMRRVASYEDILSKQRKLARRLCNYMVSGDWEEVSRHVKLINGLSAMIHEDARSLMRGMVVVEDGEEAGVAL